MQIKNKLMHKSVCSNVYLAFLKNESNTEVVLTNLIKWRKLNSQIFGVLGNEMSENAF